MGIIPYKWYVQYVFGILFILLYLVNNRFRIKINEKEKKALAILLIPNAIILVYSLFAMISNIAIIYEGSFTRAIGLFLYAELAICTGYIAYKAFRLKAIDYTFFGFAINFAICIVLQIWKSGIDSIFTYIFSNSTVKIGMIIEAHELAATIPLFFVYYLFDKNTNHRKIKLFLCIIIVIIAQKRISFPPMLLAIIFIAIFEFTKNHKKIILWLGILGLIIGYIYVISIKNGSLFDIFNGIKFMGRKQIWNGFEPFYEINLLFMGHGSGFTQKWLEINSFNLGFDVLHVLGAMHNDILRMYIEYGFWGFGLYMLNYLILNPARIEKYNSIESAKRYLTFAIIQFLIWTVDNVSTYYNFQIVFSTIVILSICETNESDNERLKNYFTKLKKLIIGKNYKKILTITYNHLKECIISLKNRLFYIVFLPCKINKNKIVFCNFYGKGYGDSPKYIAEYIIKNSLNFELVWLIDKTYEKKEFYNEIRTVEYGTFKCIYELATAGIWIDNTRKKIRPYKKKEQYYIQTWHSPLRLKKIEGDAANTLPTNYLEMAKADSRNIDLILAGCDFSYNIYRNSFWYDGEIMKCGTPRCDMFFDKDLIEDIRKSFCEKYKIEKRKKIILYAPTFRSKSDLNNLFNFDKFISLINEQDYVVLLRKHPADKTEFALNENVIDVSNYPDMQELICTSDYLITDYSSCSFDMLIANKPCILFVPDLEQYLSNERELYFRFEELPFPITKTVEEVAELIKNNDWEEYFNKTESFKEKVGMYEEGNASKKVVERIIENEKI